MDLIIYYIEFLNKFCKNVNPIIKLLRSSKEEKKSRKVDESVKSELDQTKNKKKGILLLYRIFDVI